MASNLRVDSIVPATGANVSIGTATGGVNIPGVLTYEDVTNVDSVGVITARSGIKISGITSSLLVGSAHASGQRNSVEIHTAPNDGLTISREGGGSDTDLVLLKNTNNSGTIEIRNSSNAQKIFLDSAGTSSFNGGAVMINTTNSSSRTLNLNGTFGILSTNQSGVIDMSVTDAGVASIGPYVAGGSSLELKTNASGSGVATRLKISSQGHVTKPANPVFNAFGGPSNVNTNTDIVFGQERFDIGDGYNTSTGEYTAPTTGYYHFYAQVYRQTTSSDSWWGFYLDTGSGYSQISESRMENDYGGDSGRGYSTLQSSIYWYMSAGHKIKCRVGSIGAIHCNNTLSYFCGNLVG